MCGSSVTICSDHVSRRWSVDSDTVFEVIIPLTILVAVVIGCIVLIGTMMEEERRQELYRDASEGQELSYSDPGKEDSGEGQSDLWMKLFWFPGLPAIVVISLCLVGLALAWREGRWASRLIRPFPWGEADRHYTPDSTLWRPRVGWSARGPRPTSLRFREQDPSIRLARPARRRLPRI
jgi:hypothetical protein